MTVSRLIGCWQEKGRATSSFKTPQARQMVARGKRPQDRAAAWNPDRLADIYQVRSSKAIHQITRNDSNQDVHFVLLRVMRVDRIYFSAAC